MARFVHLAILLFCLQFSAVTAAEPSAVDLLQACKDSMHGDGDTVRDMLCYWYVMPCDCEHSSDKTLPRVCLPPEASYEEMAKLVITELENQPGMQLLSAEQAAAQILAPRYPCDH